MVVLSSPGEEKACRGTGGIEAVVRWAGRGEAVRTAVVVADVLMALNDEKHTHDTKVKMIRSIIIRTGNDEEFKRTAK